MKPPCCCAPMSQVVPSEATSCPHYNTFHSCFGSAFFPVASHLDLPLPATVDWCLFWRVQLASVAALSWRLSLDQSWCPLPKPCCPLSPGLEIPAQQLWEGSWKNAHQGQVSFFFFFFAWTKTSAFISRNKLLEIILESLIKDQGIVTKLCFGF